MEKEEVIPDNTAPKSYLPLFVENYYWDPQYEFGDRTVKAGKNNCRWVSSLVSWIADNHFKQARSFTRNKINVMYSYGPSHMAGQKQDDQLEHTYSSSVRIQDVALRTSQKRWMIGRSGERGSGISILAARHDDDVLFRTNAFLKRYVPPYPSCYGLNRICCSTMMTLALNNPRRLICYWINRQKRTFQKITYFV